MSDESDEMDDEDRAFLATLVPDDALAMGFFAVAVWTDSDGVLRWRFYDQLEMALTNHIGLLELAKLEVIRRTTPSIYVGDDD